MKPYVYEGYDPAMFYWIFLGVTLLMFAFFIYEEAFARVYWGKGAVIRLIAIVVLWAAALTAFIVVDGDKKTGLKDAKQQIAKFFEDKGMRVVSGEIDPSPNKVSPIGVELPKAKDASLDEVVPCNIFSPNDRNGEITILCGENTTNGMTVDNVLKWHNDGQPEDTKPYENSAEDTKKIVEGITQE